MIKKIRFWLVILAAVNVVLLGFGLVMLSEAWYFNQEKGSHMAEMAKKVRDLEERQLWLIGASGCYAMAAMDSAIGAASFAFASIAVGWTALIIELRKQ